MILSVQSCHALNCVGHCHIMHCVACMDILTVGHYHSCGVVSVFLYRLIVIMLHQFVNTRMCVAVICYEIVLLLSFVSQYSPLLVVLSDSRPNGLHQTA